MIDRRKTATKLKDRNGIYQTVTALNIYIEYHAKSRQETNKEFFFTNWIAAVQLTKIRHVPFLNCLLDIPVLYLYRQKSFILQYDKAFLFLSIRHTCIILVKTKILYFAV